jgi:hypothetical protein
MKNAHEILMASHTSIPAADIARQLCVPVEYVYLELVRLEGMGLARVDVNFANGDKSCSWSAMPYRFIGEAA